MQTSIRLIRPAPDPLGHFIRAGHADQKDLQTFVLSGATAFTGVVVEAKRAARQKELLSLAHERQLDTVLDPQTQAMATVGGYAPGMDVLPWSKKRPHNVGDFQTEFQQRQLADQIAQFVEAHAFTQVLAPTHVISGPDDPWFEIDISTANALRNALDRGGLGKVQVNYSLAISYDAFRTPAKRAMIVERLRSISADNLWLNVDGCGSDSSPTAVTRYADASLEFQSLKLPLVSDHMGGLVGLSLLAFGAAGGLSHGITLGERFNVGHWNKIPNGKAFSQKQRVYIPGLDMLLNRVDTEKFFETGGRARSAFGCRDTNCCARGIADMLQHPARHFLYQRTREIAGLAQIPESLRPGRFLEEHLRPASDRALLATSLDLPEDLAKKALTQSKRLNDLRIALGAYVQKRRDATFARHPQTRVARDANG